MKLFINTYYENASILRWEQNENGIIDLFLIQDHERLSPNHQITHWNFKVEIVPEHLGEMMTFRFRSMTGCWNGKSYRALAGHELVTAISYNGSIWETVECTPSEHPECGPEFSVKIKSELIQIAHLVPYTDSMLQKTICELEEAQDVRVYKIGATAEGRTLEMIEIGNSDANNQILLRGRAHPWESGGSWLLEGLMRYLVLEADESAEQIKKNTCFCIMPMANKDGVYRGMTRFNVRGVDLARGWYQTPPVDAVHAPEKACLYNWLCRRKICGILPKLVIDLHNDSYGQLHFTHAKGEGYRQHMEMFEKLLKEHSWFTEGSSGSSGANLSASLFDFDVMVYELKDLAVDGLGGRPALHTDWMDQGENLARTIYAYFSSLSVRY